MDNLLRGVGAIELEKLLSILKVIHYPVVCYSADAVMMQFIK